MSNCSICCRKITRHRHLDLNNSNTCTHCITNIKATYDDFTTEKSSLENRNQSNDTQNTSPDGINEENNNLIYIGGKEISVTQDIDIDIEKCERALNVLESHKDALLANLYSQVEFLKN